MKLEYQGQSPKVADSAFLAPNATLIGDVTISENASVFYGAVLRADRDRIVLGEGSNLQDGVLVHGDPGKPTIVGSGVSVGHGAVLHGCIVEDNCLIGMRATVLNGAVVGKGSLIAAGAVVLEGEVIPPGSLVAGVPAKVRRALLPEEQEHIQRNAETYRMLAKQHIELNG